MVHMPCLDCFIPLAHWLFLLSPCAVSSTWAQHASDMPAKNGLHAQVHQWELRLAAMEASKDSKKPAEAGGVHALLQGPQDDQEADPAAENVFAELGLKDPLLLDVGAARGGPSAGPQGAHLRRSNSSRSTASRMSSKSPPRGRQGTSYSMSASLAIAFLADFAGVAAHRPCRCHVCPATGCVPHVQGPCNCLT